jgi:hypothetical protein
VTQIWALTGALDGSSDGCVLVVVRGEMGMVTMCDIVAFQLWLLDLATHRCL